MAAENVVQKVAETNGVVAKGGDGGAVVFTAMKPRLVVEAPKAADAITFYKKAFGAVEVIPKMNHKRKADQELPLILHAHLKVGPFEFIVCDETDDIGADVKSPVTKKGASMIVQLETECVEEAFKRATEAGASVTEEVAEKSWGQRYGVLKDPYGFVWSLATPAKPSEAPVAAAAETEVPAAEAQA